MCCFFGNSRRRDVVGCPRMADTLPPVSQHNHMACSRISLLYYALAQSRKDDITACTWMVMPLDVGELLSTGTVPCIAATILCLILENWRNSESEVIQQCALDGTSLSSDVLIPRVRTLALC